jgi:glucosamine--fructose-6-phosphate aminotransferase (isomerizing)
MLRGPCLLTPHAQCHCPPPPHHHHHPLHQVANLRDATATQDCSATIGIAHTRWATHGAPDDKNAHPHFSTDRSVAVVHNGIIENYRELQTMLEKLHGYVFASETDTELLAHLVHHVRVWGG